MWQQKAILIWDLERSEKVHKGTINMYAEIIYFLILPDVLPNLLFSPDSIIPPFLPAAVIHWCIIFPPASSEIPFGEAGDNTWFDAAWSSDGNWKVIHQYGRPLWYTISPPGIFSVATLLL